MTFLEYLALLQRRWRAWVSMILIGLLAALAVSLLAKERYVAVSTSFVTVADEDAAGAGESFQGSQFITQRMVSYAALSTSPTVVEGVIEELELDLTPRELKESVEVGSPTGTVMLEVSAEHTEPQQAASISNTVSEQLGLLIEEIETPRGLAASSVEVVLTHPAPVPTEPSSPRTKLNLFLGLAVGAAAGVVVALLREHVDRRLKSAADIRAITGAKPLGSAVVTRAGKGEPFIALRPRSVEAEHYRAIRTAVKLAHPDVELRHVAVSSPTERDGAAGETANLAVTWALGGARVCVVDAGLRHRALSQLLDVENSVGLSDVLVGDVELSEALTPWNGGTLTVLPAGFEPQDPAELLASEAMTLLVGDLRSRFDIVLYDAGPMLESADAVVLARALDGVVLVARARTTTKDELAGAVETVREARLPLLGTVLSGVAAGRRAERRNGHVAREPRRPSGPAQPRAELSPSL